MGKIYNEIGIGSDVEKIWSILADPAKLDQYDPTVKKSTLISAERTGPGAKRKVEMLDGKNWFEEKITDFEPNKRLTYQLTACSFPIHRLKHTYTFEVKGNQTIVKQVMDYTVKFGFLGRIMDALMIRKQSDAGIKKFFAGLKEFAEKQ
jgi:uncharacterized protein YndB with AHSA1/START domain